MNETHLHPKTPPSPSGLPLLGHAYAYASDPLGFVERTVEECGPVTSLSIPGHEVVLLADPEAIEHVLARNHENYCKGEFQKKEFDGLLGDGLLVSEGEQWERQHAQIQPAFYPGRIAEYAETMVAGTEQHLTRWEDRDHETLTLTDALPELTLDILGQVLFGTDLREATEVRTAAEAITERFTPDGRVPFYVPDWVPTPRNRRYLRAVERLDSFVADLVATRRRETDSPDDDLLSTLLSSGMNDEEVRDQLVTFLLAGHETTALALTYTLYLLGKHPDVQARVAEEVAGLGERPQLGDDLPRTDRAIREAMRLYPPTTLLMRETIEADEISGYEIPEGALVLCSQWATHRRSAFFENPDEFRPERWTDDRKEDRESDSERPDYAYFPFGGGSRACIGRRFALFEMRLVLASLLQRFEVRTVSPEDLEPVAAMTLSPGDDVVVELRKRT